MRTYRKKNGFASVERVLNKMLPDTPLAMNLNNKEYMKILLRGKTLEERFAEIDSRQIRNRLVHTAMGPGSTSPRIRKIIRLPNLVESIVTLLQQAAS